MVQVRSRRCLRPQHISGWCSSDLHPLEAASSLEIKAPLTVFLLVRPDLHRSVRDAVICFVFVLVMGFRLLLDDTLIRCSCGR